MLFFWYSFIDNNSLKPLFFFVSFFICRRYAELEEAHADGTEMVDTVIMKFTGGTSCWNGPDRVFAVRKKKSRHYIEH